MIYYNDVDFFLFLNYYIIIYNIVSINLFSIIIIKIIIFFIFLFMIRLCILDRLIFFDGIILCILCFFVT